MGAWRVIGFFGSLDASPVPLVLPAAVLDPEGKTVVPSDIASGDAELRRQEAMSLAEFGECLACGSATTLPAFAWEPGAVLFFEGGSLELVSVWEAEVRMKAFVRTHRARGKAAIDREDLAAALQAFDLARRVSNEREDIEQVVELSPEPAVREFFAEQLSHLTLRELTF